MLIIESYIVAVTLSIITMICWGSWANTQKLASREWKYQLFYWDYGIGVLLSGSGRSCWPLPPAASAPKGGAF